MGIGAKSTRVEDISVLYVADIGRLDFLWPYDLSQGHGRRCAGLVSIDGRDKIMWRRNGVR
jgi:hypothetical protein